MSFMAAYPEFRDAYNKLPAKLANGPHGLGHWIRVAENGFWLADELGVNKRVIILFAAYHDAWRTHDGSDLMHGHLAADAMMNMDLDLEPNDRDRLLTAVRMHPLGQTTSDPLIGACWDADRLDLSRVGVVPHPDYMSTEPAIDSLMRQYEAETDTVSLRAARAAANNFN